MSESPRTSVRTKIEDRGLWFENRRSKFEDRGSKFEDYEASDQLSANRSFFPRSSILDLRSSILSGGCNNPIDIAGGEAIACKKFTSRSGLDNAVDEEVSLANQVFGLPARPGQAHHFDGLSQGDVRAGKWKDVVSQWPPRSPSSRPSRSFNWSSAAADQWKSAGGLKPPSLEKVAVGAGVNGKIPRTLSLSRSSKPVTPLKSATSMVPGANGAGPSVINTSCSIRKGGWTAPATWART